MKTNESGWHLPTEEDIITLKNYHKMGNDKERLEENIEAAASLYIGKGLDAILDDKDRIAKAAYIAGAKSMPAKEYHLHIK